MGIKKDHLVDKLVSRFGFGAPKKGRRKHHPLRLMHNNKIVAQTRYSSSWGTVADSMLATIGKQLHVDGATLKKMCECTVSSSQYINLLRSRGRLDPPTTPGQTPTLGRTIAAIRRHPAQAGTWQHSLAGSLYLERALTAAANLGLPTRILFDYLTDATTAHFIDQPAPSLPPIRCSRERIHRL